MLIFQGGILWRYLPAWRARWLDTHTYCWTIGNALLFWNLVRLEVVRAFHVVWFFFDLLLPHTGKVHDRNNHWYHKTMSLLWRLWIGFHSTLNQSPRSDSGKQERSCGNYFYHLLSVLTHRQVRKMKSNKWKHVRMFVCLYVCMHVCM